jgi:magnesium-transporting ATPase (P-type)
MTGESDHFAKESFEDCMKLRDEYMVETKTGTDQIPEGAGAHDIPSCVLLSGTQVQTGQGKFVAIVCGELTCEGQILASVEQTE